MNRLFIALLGLSLALARAASSEWTDADGSRFTGEPAAVFGSLALFRTAAPQLRRVPCARFRPRTASDFTGHWPNSPAGAPAGPTPGVAPPASCRAPCTPRLPVPQARAGRSLRPAPNRSCSSSSMAITAMPPPGPWPTTCSPPTSASARVYPGLMATVFYGLGHTADEHRRITIETWSPWLVTDFSKQRLMPVIGRHAPPEGSAMAVITRDGDLVLSARPVNLTAIRQFIDDVSDLVWTANPLNSRAWADRAHYERAVRSLKHATADTGPELIGNPLRADGLRQRGVGRVEARLELDATGKVAAVTLQPGSVVPEKMAGPLTDALRRSAIYLPAMAGGQAVASSCDYVLEVPPADPQAEADATWLDRSIRGEVPLLNWKLLTTIPVNQQEFDEIEGTGPDGRVILRAVEISKRRISRASQESAFHSDFFGENGAAGVVPEDGQTQVVDGKPYTWRSIQSHNGYVNLQEGQFPRPEYCVGYAWTEIEVSADTSAWLGIGSDDGLKVWHNGVLVNDRWTRRISRIDDDIVPLRLKAGKNHLLIKIQNVTGDWSFVTRLRFRDR